MLSLHAHLSQTTSELAHLAMAAEAVELRNALTGVLLIGALATLAALMSAARRLLSQAVQLLEEALRFLLLAGLAGLVVVAVILLAVADLLAG
jgi:hypothetical protein